MSKPRNDSFLYSGITSSTNSRREVAKEKRSDRRQEKIEARGKLLPAADIVFNAIEDEKRSTFEKLAKLPMAASTNEKRVMARLEAVQMHIDFLERFKNSMGNKLRANPRARQEAQDEEGSEDE